MLTPDTKIPSLSSQSERKLLLFTSLMHTKAKYTSSRGDLRSVFYYSENNLTVLFFFFFFTLREGKKQRDVAGGLTSIYSKTGTTPFYSISVWRWSKLESAE